MIKFKTNNETAEISTDGGKTWKHIGDCCESLYDLLSGIASELDAELIYEEL